MGLSFVPEQGNVLGVLEKIATANNITHFNLVGYTHRVDKDYPNDGGNIDFIHPVDLAQDRGFITSNVSKVEGSSNSYVGISSLVRLGDSKPAHIFQFDYDGVLPLENFRSFLTKLEDVSRSFSSQKNPLYLFSSGKGYHVYGGAIKYEEFPNVLGSLRKAEIADSKWIDLSSARGFGDLRISKNQTKPIAPTLLGRLV